MKTVEIKDIDFLKYGTYISIPEEKEPTKQGPDWKCWSFEGSIDINGTAYIGVVFSEYKDNVQIEKMERHCSRKEILICADAPVVLPIAKSINMDDKTEKPLYHNLINVVMREGDIVIINEGVWHAACYPLEKDCKYYFIIENSQTLTEGDVWMQVQK